MSAVVFADGNLTEDGFLGGRLRLLQPIKGYRAGLDPVLLAASVPAWAGQSVLDLGCGAGAAMLCLAARSPGLRIAGVELQPDYAALARRNAAANEVKAEVLCADLADLPAPLRRVQFDHVIANPPYYRFGAHSRANDTGRAVALGDGLALSDWVAIAARRLVAKGYLHVIQRADRLPELLAGCAGRLGSIEVLPLAARTGRAPDLVILRARKGGRGAFRLHAPLILHRGPAHSRDGKNYVPQIESVLRSGDALEWPR